MKTIKKINILSLAKIMGLINGGVYLIAGLAVNLAVLFLGVPALAKFDLLGFGSGILAVLLLAILIGAISFIMGALIAWLYNVASGMVGGIIWEEQEVKKPLPDFDLEKIRNREHLATSAKPQTEVNNVLGRDNDTFHS